MVLRTAWFVGLAAAFSLVTLAETSAVSAQNNEAAARQHFRLGQAHYQNGQFEEAAREFEEAYRLSPAPRLMFNAYLAYRDMQDLPNAARTLRAFLGTANDLDPAERDQLAARLAAIDQALERLRSTPRDPGPTDAGTSTGSSTASAPRESVGGGERAPVGSPPSGSGSGGGGLSPVGFVVGGVGVALGIGSIVTGVMSSSDLSMLANECQNDVCPDRPDLRDAHSRGQTLAVVTDVLWVSGVVALGVGVALIFALQEGGSSDTTAAASCTAEGCFGAVRTRF